MKKRRKCLAGILFGTAIGVLLTRYSPFFLPLGISIGSLIGTVLDKKELQNSSKDDKTQSE